MLTKQEEDRDKLDTFQNDLKVREQQKQAEASSYLDQYHSDVGGRFSVTEHETVTGRVSPKPPPLPASSPWSGSQPQPPIEPPTGYEINRLTRYELEPSMAVPASPAIEDPGAPVTEAPLSDHLPPADDVETGTGAPPSSQKNQDNG